MCAFETLFPESKRLLLFLPFLTTNLIFIFENYSVTAVLPTWVKKKGTS